MKLTKNFDLSEFTAINYLELDKTIFNNIQSLAHLVQSARDHLGCKIKITSGLRSKVKNDSIVGASKSSQHLNGQACDIVSLNPGKVTNLDILNYFKDNIKKLGIDQLINEKPHYGVPSWIHVSIAKNPRGMYFTIY